MDGKSQDTIETRLYCITFLLIEGNEDGNWTRIWVMGNCEHVNHSQEQNQKRRL
jgi:hypothetical protein